MVASFPEATVIYHVLLNSLINIDTAISLQYSSLISFPGMVGDWNVDRGAGPCLQAAHRQIVLQNEM